MSWLLTMFCAEFRLKREDACFDFASSSLPPELGFLLFRYQFFHFCFFFQVCVREEMEVSLSYIVLLSNFW